MRNTSSARKNIGLSEPDGDGMYVIMVYDVNVKRVNRILKIGRQYLSWVQNSVFEGEITKADFEQLKLDLKKALDSRTDSIIFYILRTTKYLTKETLGVSKGGFDIIQ